PSPSSPLVRLAWTTSKPPEPSPRSSPSVLTITSSPSRTGPTSASSAQTGRSSPATLTASGSVPTTTPLRSFSNAASPPLARRRFATPPPPRLGRRRPGRRLDRRLAHSQHLHDRSPGDQLLRGVVRLGAVREQHGLVAGGEQGVCVAAAAGRNQLRLAARALQRLGGDLHRSRLRIEPEAAEDLGDACVDVASMLAGRPRAGIDHVPDRGGRPLAVYPTRLREDHALARHHVRGGAALDHPHVGRGLLVEPAELHTRHRRRPPADPA